MNIEPIIFFDMIAAILILSVILISVALYFSHRAKKIHEKVQSNFMDDAHQKAAKIIDEANSKAFDIVAKANLSLDASSAKFNEQALITASQQVKEFKKTTAEFTGIYNRILQDLKLKNIEVFQNVSNDIEKGALEEIKSFRESVERLTISSEDLVKKKIDSDYKIVKQEISAYKENELKKIRDSIYELLEKISKITLGKALNLSDHEDLVIESMEKAINEGVFKE